MAKQIGSTSVTMGDEIPRVSGIFEGIEERADKQNEGKTLRVVILSQKEGGKISVRLNPILSDQLSGVEKGSRIGISYDGTLPSKSGKTPTKLYSVWSLDSDEEF